MTTYEKAYGTCPECHKYKGLWTDSNLCDDCDEAEADRKAGVCNAESDAAEQEEEE